MYAQDSVCHVTQNTERPETVEVGANVLIGRDQELALEASSASSWSRPISTFAPTSTVSGRSVFCVT